MAVNLSPSELLTRAKAQLISLNQRLNVMDKLLPVSNQISNRRDAPTTPVRKPYIRPYSCDKFSTQIKRQQLRSLEKRVDIQLQTFNKLSRLYSEAKQRNLIQ